MNHDDAMRTSAAERYVLNCLSAFEAEEFERHFFDCFQCCQRLKTLAILQDNARAMWLDQDVVTPSAPVAAPEPEPAPVRESLFARISAAIRRGRKKPR